MSGMKAGLHLPKRQLKTELVRAERVTRAHTRKHFLKNDGKVRSEVRVAHIA
jgi:hypothetical protein